MGIKHRLRVVWFKLFISQNNRETRARIVTKFNEYFIFTILIDSFIHSFIIFMFHKNMQL